MHLVRAEELTAEADAFVARHGGPVGLAGAFDHLDRRLRRTWAPCASPHRAWTWDRTDRRDPRWWPQGISVEPGGARVAVSWYAEDGGVRVSLLDLARRRYGHVVLVRPTESGHRPLAVHAGGLAWHGDRLYVAATRAGLWVCDTDDVVRSAGDHLLPVRYRLAPEADDPGGPVRFSFVGVDDATDPPSLVAGEYGRGSQTLRMVEVPVDGGPAEVAAHGVPGAQGVARVRGRLHLTASHGPWGLGSVWSGAPGCLRERRWALPMGPEDLAYDARTDRLWTVTEHPRRRWIVSVKRSRFG